MLIYSENECQRDFAPRIHDQALVETRIEGNRSVNDSDLARIERMQRRHRRQWRQSRNAAIRGARGWSLSLW